jgi:cytochrome c oxidase cbb3-type subunit III
MLVLKINNLYKGLALLAVLIISPHFLIAQTPKPSSMSNPLAQTLIIIIAALALIIGLLAFVVLGAAQIYVQRFKEDDAKAKSSYSTISATIIALFISINGWSQSNSSETSTSINTDIGGLSYTTFFTLISVITIEVILIFGLLYNLWVLLQKEIMVQPNTAINVASTKAINWSKIWWDKLNNVTPIKEEAAIDLGHNYDGIRELDNRLPPWWLYGFYMCVIFAGIYLWRFHVSHTALSSKEELEVAMVAAAEEKEAYLLKAANNIDENNVVMLDASGIASGKKIFESVCAACHLTDGGGSVGPNLTDNYWLHGGDVKSIFKTLKYGWPEKGMKSWKDDYSPIQLAQITSYVKSLQGTKPAKAKEPQGVLESNTPSIDSIPPKTVDTKVIAASF